MMTINLCGRPTKVDAARLVLILVAAWRVEILRELRRLPLAGDGATEEQILRWVELQNELQVMDELANQQRQVMP